MEKVLKVQFANRWDFEVGFDALLKLGYTYKGSVAPERSPYFYVLQDGSIGHIHIQGENLPEYQPRERISSSVINGCYGEDELDRKIKELHEYEALEREKAANYFSDIDCSETTLNELIERLKVTGQEPLYNWLPMFESERKLFEKSLKKKGVSLEYIVWRSHGVGKLWHVYGYGEYDINYKRVEEKLGLTDSELDDFITSYSIKLEEMDNNLMFWFGVAQLKKIKDDWIESQRVTALLPDIYSHENLSDCIGVLDGIKTLK